jgi:hypothetical protein
VRHTTPQLSAARSRSAARTLYVSEPLWRAIEPLRRAVGHGGGVGDEEGGNSGAVADLCERTPQTDVRTGGGVGKNGVEEGGGGWGVWNMLWVEEGGV